MQFSNPPHTQKEVASQAERLTVRMFFGAGLIASLTAAIALGLLGFELSVSTRLALVGMTLLLAGVFAACGAALQRFGMARSATVTGWATLAVVTFVAAVLGETIQGESVQGFALGFYVVVICTGSITIGPRAGLAMALFAAVAIACLDGFTRTRGFGIGGVSEAADAALVLRVILQWLAIGTAASTGALVARINTLYMDAAAERERRFRGMLRIAADWYWEMDDQFRFTHIEEAAPQASFLRTEDRIGFTPWEIESIGIDPGAMDAHRSDLEAHRPFRGVFVRREDELGRARFARVSGQPRFDARGIFIGYWGVGRDTTVEVRAQMSVAASEARYRELFKRTPSPLVLHREGSIIDANPAAIALFGYAHLNEMIGRDFERHFDARAAGESLQERQAAFERLQIGEGLPPAPMNLLTRDGRIRHVRVAPVKVDTADGAAAVSILYDDTDQRLADAALRRSESLLSSLVASSPDSITLSELDSGRYVMVNDAYTRMFGFTREEAIGRTSAEIKTWADPADRDRLVSAIIDHGRIDQYPQSFLDKRGVPIQAMVAGATFEVDGAHYLVLASRDVTETERTRLEHQAILQSAVIGIAFIRDQRFLHANPYFERIFGWPEGALAGERGSVVWPTQRDYEEIGRIAGPLLAEGKPVELERLMRRLDGSVFWCRLLAMVVDKRAPQHSGTIWIAEDVTERRRVEQALAAARDAAEAASRAKSAFLANTSHEIRTPLNGLLGLTQLAMHEALDDTRRRQYLAQIHDSAQSLAGIMSDILDLSKIEAGKLTLESMAFDLPEVLTAVHHAYLSLAEHKGLVMQIELAHDLPRAVRGDPVRLRQILSNYLTNAIKFTEIGTVRLVARVLPSGWLRLEVTDTGPGIGTQTLPRLFTPFTQADESTTRRFGGTGLGLSICRELAQLMGGDVGVISQPGSGSTFWAELPLPTAAASDVADARPPGDTDHLRGTRVLVAEDNSVNMMIALAMLEQWGIRTAQAADGHDAVEAVLRAARDGEPFDAVLMDVQMPRMSGHEAARAIRRSFDADALPIVALTAAALVSERDEAMAAGMNDFMTKPIDARRLRETLARHLRKRPAADA